MLLKTIFAGFGGQGVLMMGYSLAHAAMNAGFHTTYLPSYGAEVRGGTANCTVAISDEEIASPVASAPDYLVILNMPSLYSFQNRIAAGGCIFLNSSIIEGRPSRKDVRVFEIPAGEIAERIGDPRTTNVVMLGAFLKQTAIVKPETYLQSLKEIMGGRKKGIMEVNRKAFSAGFDLFETSREESRT
ncbi:MAG: NADH-dependent phenylglyoxylate dehydrogenase subunit gamma [Syntrophaceae bacterium PtaU1.Bin231]|nr:MAG: NADH-dependent phenylglyoxylate dehydrogenase subunit gamma [Syntrophaceae bacterium PtaU1.Bin231]